MKTALLVAVSLAALVSLGSTSAAQKAGPHDAEFHAFYADFLKACRDNDKDKIADMIAFPVQDWSTNIKNNVQTGSIKDRADFIARYNVLFTNYMRLHLPKAKVEQLKDGRYFSAWKDVDIQCSFDFVYVEGTGFRVGSYTIGPL